MSGGYLDALLADLLSAEASEDRVKAFAKMKKSEKAATMERLFSDSTTQTLYALTPQQIARIGQWVPDCLQPKAEGRRLSPLTPCPELQYHAPLSLAYRRTT